MQHLLDPRQVTTVRLERTYHFYFAMEETKVQGCWVVH
jgi:hypothetical protein